MTSTAWSLRIMVQGDKSAFLSLLSTEDTKKNENEASASLAYN